MEQGQHAEAEENELGQRIPYDRQQVRMVGRVEPPERKRNSEQEHRTGRTSAAAMPPALNSSHRKGRVISDGARLRS